MCISTDHGYYNVCFEVVNVLMVTEFQSEKEALCLYIDTVYRRDIIDVEIFPLISTLT